MAKKTCDWVGFFIDDFKELPDVDSIKGKAIGFVALFIVESPISLLIEASLAKLFLLV